MRLILRLFLFSFLPLIQAYSSHAMLVFGQTAVSPDKKRYIAYLGHHHEQTNTDIEARQLEALVAICKEGAQEGKKFHILYERTSDLMKFFMPRKTVLGDIEEIFTAAQVPNCTVENIEMRDCGAAAGHIFYYKGKVFGDDIAWNNNSKPFNELTFQDMFDEFEKYALEIEPFIQKMMQENAESPYIFLLEEKLLEAREPLNRIKEFLQTIERPAQTKILDLARERQDDCNALEKTTRHAFSDLFDLHIFRRLTQLDPSVQPLVVTGGIHSLRVNQLFDELKWETCLIRGQMYREIGNPINYNTLRAIILNQTEWAGFRKDTFKYLSCVTVFFGTQFQTLRETILSRYCK